MSHNAYMTLSTRVDSQLNTLAIESAAKVGLDVADLIRTGLHNVCGEIAATGSLRVARAPVRLSPDQEKEGAAK